MIATNTTNITSESQYTGGMNGIGCASCSNSSNSCSGCSRKGIGFGDIPVGQDCSSGECVATYLSDLPIGDNNLGIPTSIGSGSYPTNNNSGSNFNLQSLLTTGLNDTASVLSKVLPAGSVTLQTANGLVTVPAGSVSAQQLLSQVTSGSIGSYLPWLLIGGAGLLIFSAMGKR